MRTALLLIAVACSATAFGETPGFEVASIRHSVAAREWGRTGAALPSGDPGTIRWRNTTLWSVLLRAYELKPYQIECPSWMRVEEYDISANAPAGTTKDQIPAMLQRLLADRFQMKIRREKRERQVYALVLGKDGPKLKPAQRPDDGIGFTMGGPTSELTAGSIDGLVRMLSGSLDRPVLDKTGIAGQYDIRLFVAAEDLVGLRRINAATQGADATTPTPAPGATPGPSIFTAVQQLGLKLESQTAPIEFLIVEKAEKNPTEN